MNISYKKSKIALGFLAALGVASVQAANTPTSATASVTVNGALTIVKSADMSFGSIVATYAGTGGTEATLALSPLEGAATPSTATNAAASAVNGKVTILTQGTPAKFTIAGAGANANLIITTTLGDTATSLTNGSTPSATALAIAAPTIYDVTNSTFKTFTSFVSDALTTDATGALEFNMGATITVPLVAGAAYSSVPNGTYSGSFTVVANYQ